MKAAFHSIEQARARAKAKLPAFAFDFLDGGAGDEQAIAGNLNHLRQLALVPRVFGSKPPPDLSTTLCGCTYALPFGIAPMGLPAIAWPGAEAGFAAASATHRIPFALSCAAGMTISEAAAASGGNAWFQLYPDGTPPGEDHRIAEAIAAGVSVLVLTVDRPVMGWRVRDLTHGVGLGMKLGPRALISMAAHPRWSLATARAGKPRPVYLPAGSGQAALGANPEAITALRKAWPGALLIKGILHPEDALIARDSGADGIIVSNHGGAHLASAVTPAAQLPAIRAAVGPDWPVLLDGGVRSGEDIAKVLALGADFVLLGRAFAYAAAAAGPMAGPATAITLLREGLSRALSLMGCTSPADLKPHHVVWRESAPALNV